VASIVDLGVFLVTWSRPTVVFEPNKYLRLLLLLLQQMSVERR